MKQRKMKVAVSALAAVGCMSTSAMAIEHEFNGLLRVKGIFTNFDQAGGNDASLKTKDLSAGNLGKSFFFTEQRARLKYTGTLANDVKLVTHFEIDSRWGDTSQNNGRGAGGAMEADQVNLETKNVFMQFKVPYLPTTVRAGIQPVDDMYKGIFVGTDAAAVSTVTKLDKATIYATWMRGYDNKNFKGANETVPAVNAGSTGLGATGNMPGRYSLDSFLFDAKFDINKKLKVGGSYYMVYENLVAGNGYNVLNTLGVNAAYNFGPGSVDGFLLYQMGDNPVNNFGQTGEKVSAFAANVGGKIKAGPGTARANFLYASGDNGTGKVNAFQGLNQLGEGNTTSTFSAAQMTMLITNTKYAANTDRALINNITNNNMGVKGAFLGYDVDIDKAFIKGNLGMAAVANKNQNSRPNLKGGSNSSYIGTEINAEVGYKISQNLTASWVGGYVVLGDYYKDTVTVNGVIKTPDNPWKNMVVLNLAF